MRGVEFRTANVRSALPILLHVRVGLLALVVLGVFLDHDLRSGRQTEAVGNHFKGEGVAFLRLEGEPVPVIRGGELAGDGGGQGNLLRLVPGFVRLGLDHDGSVGKGQQRGIGELSIGTLHPVLETVEARSRAAERCAGGQPLPHQGVARSGDVHRELVE